MRDLWNQLVEGWKAGRRRRQSEKPVRKATDAEKTYAKIRILMACSGVSCSPPDSIKGNSKPPSKDTSHPSD